MTPAHRDALAAKDAALDAVQAAWAARAAELVARKVGDAHAHGSHALTRALRETPDGRPSLLRLGRHPSHRAALARLAELHEALAGPSTSSLSGLVRDAREALYREAAGHWHPLIAREHRSRDDPGPTRAQAARVRAAALHGYDPRAHLATPIEGAARGLKAALERDGRTGGGDDGHLDRWRDATAGVLTRAAALLISDSRVYADRMAGVDLIRPEMLEG